MTPSRLDKLPLPALMWVAMFTSATGSWLLGQWISLLSGYDLGAETKLAAMFVAAFCGGLGALLSRAM